VQDAARRFVVVGERRTLAPAVVALRSHASALLESEIERARAKGDDGRTEQALRHLMGRLLHTPTTRAHQLAEQGRADAYLEALDTLFGIQVDAADLEMDAPRRGADDVRDDLAG
jgi:glutamyl-tRNA reductase